jgi:hypothetical protein
VSRLIKKKLENVYLCSYPDDVNISVCASLDRKYAIRVLYFMGVKIVSLYMIAKHQVVFISSTTSCVGLVRFNLE